MNLSFVRFGSKILVIQPKVIVDMNLDLLRNFITEEVKEAIMQMASLKSPDSDGFNTDFYHSY